MREKQKQPASFQPDRILSYFKAEWQVLLAVTISGLIYNVGLLAGPWFEGKMTGCLVDILRGAGQFGDMLILVLSYVAVIVIVQSSRYIKRFYVRRFANNVNRRMKEILYGSLVRKSRASLKEEGEGNVITKAILDVDDCVEGMRKFTTEIFDTGMALAAYAGMLLWYDWAAGALMYAVSANLLHDRRKNEKNDPENRGCLQGTVRRAERSDVRPGRKCNHIPCFRA